MSRYIEAHTPSGLLVRYLTEEEQGELDSIFILPFLLPAIAEDRVRVIDEQFGAAFVTIDANLYLVCPLNADGTISGDWNSVMVDDVEEDILIQLQQHGVIPKESEVMGTGNIKGMRCPACGNYKGFYISMRVVMQATAGGIYAQGDYEWGDDSECTCTGCGHNGIVSDFKPGK